MQTKTQWEEICKDWNELPFASVKVSSVPTGWRVTESHLDLVVFDFIRNLDDSRFTIVESSLVGVTTLTMSQDLPVFLTEGVSDFLALKILLPECNVVGHTHTQWSQKDIAFLSNFRKVIYCHDSDKAGIKAAASARLKFPPKKLAIVSPYFSTSKDVAKDYMRSTNKEIKEYVIAHYKAQEV